MAELGWNPWRALRARPWVSLEWCRLSGTRGLITQSAVGATIWIDERLGQRTRSAVLAHELVHEERGLFYDRSTPRALVAKEEAAVVRETARRLVPDAGLAELAASGEPVELWEVADRFGVPEDVARAAVSSFLARCRR